jgi:hypothetical protein
LELSTRLPELPEHSREAVEQELATLDFLETQVESLELTWCGCINGSGAPRIIKKRWSPSGATWQKQLGGFLPSRKFIASPGARGCRLFRRRTGKRVCGTSPMRLTNDCETRSAE